MTAQAPQAGAAGALSPGCGAARPGHRRGLVRSGWPTPAQAAPQSRAAPAGPAPVPSRPVPPGATDLSRRRGTGSCRPAGPCPGRALGRAGRGGRGRACVRPGSAGHMAWCGRAAASGAPIGAAAWPGRCRRAGHSAARTGAARGRAGVWFLPAEEGGLWGGSSSRPPRSRRG